MRALASRPAIVMSLELVQVVRKFWHLDLESLALSDCQDHVLHLACLQRITWHGVPVVEDALRESLTTGLLSQCGNEAEGLCNRQVCLDLQERSAFAWVLLEDASASEVHARVHTAHGLLGAGDLHQEDRLLECWLSCHLCRESNAAHWRCNLASTTVDCIGVQRHIQEVEADTAHVLLAEWTFLGTPLECTVHMLLNLKEVGNTHGLINHDIGSISLWPPAPDLSGSIITPIMLLLIQLDTLLGFRLWPGFPILDVFAQLVAQRFSGDVQTIVLVW
mmetsp:Transcript_113620/g.200573  ORF Transcript_113620/g.200573 Transcript_113620/m.200573 type:complete len:277 (+) Transcript_113620:123-953(+)